MSISTSGLIAKSKVTTVSISLPKSHPLLLLQDMLPWDGMYKLIEPDLKKTKKGCWRLGRPLQVRLHLGVYILQQLYNLTDRKAEYGVKDNAAYQLFCGCDVVSKWHAPDHTNIEKFRSRLLPETQRSLNDLTLGIAVKLGFADPSKMDVDSTIQNSNMAYPSDANLLVKMSGLCGKIRSFVAKHIAFPESVERIKSRMKEIKAVAKEYLFTSGKSEKNKEKKTTAFNKLLAKVSSDVTGVMEIPLHEDDLKALPWNIKQAWNQVKANWKQLLLGAQIYIATNQRLAEKPLSLHINHVSCFNKGKKTGKPLQFGRAYQLGRIGGNFIIAFPSTSIRMEDKHSVQEALKHHQKLFGPENLKSCGFDKGFYSNANHKKLVALGIEEFCLQKPGFDTNGLEQTKKETHLRLVDRRSGIEPLIGHAKHGGQLGRSRMKKDQSTLAAGYAAVLGLNLRQLIRHAAGKKILAMT